MEDNLKIELAGQKARNAELQKIADHMRTALVAIKDRIGDVDKLNATERGEAIKLPQPIPYRGAQGMFIVPDELLPKVAA